MADFSFGFIEGSFLPLNDQKHLMSVAEDLAGNKQKELNEFIKNGEGTDIINLSSQYFSAGRNCLISTRRVKINITWWRRHPYSCIVFEHTLVAGSYCASFYIYLLQV